MTQQLNSGYQGDRSDTLAQILGLDYDPQGAMAQMAQSMLQTGMGSSTQLKTAAMAQQGADNREFIARQTEMNRNRRDQTMLRNAAGAQLRGRQEGILKTLGMYMGMLDQYPDDPVMAEEARQLKGMIYGLQGAFSQPGALESRVAMLNELVNRGMTDARTAGGVAGLRYDPAVRKAPAAPAPASADSSSSTSAPSAGAPPEGKKPGWKEEI